MFHVHLRRMDFLLSLQLEAFWALLKEFSFTSLSEALIINIRAINIFSQLKKLEKRMEGNSKGRMRNQRQKEGELVIAN